MYSLEKRGVFLLILCFVCAPFPKALYVLGYLIQTLLFSGAITHAFTQHHRLALKDAGIPLLV
jgi:hypothetical protein